MPRKLPAVDDYIAEAPAYAQPILRRIRRVFLRASPKIEEAIKWGAPHFVYEGIVYDHIELSGYVLFKGLSGRIPESTVHCAWPEYQIRIPAKCDAGP